jgi:hypothetical protein
MLCKEWELYKIEERDPMNKYNPVYITQVSTTNKDVYEKYEFTSNGRYRHEKNSVIETGVWISDKEFTMLGLFTDTINGNYSSNYDDNKNKNDFGCPLYCKQRKIELTDSDLTITWSGRDGGVIYYYRMMK